MNPVWHENFKVGISSTEKTLEFKVNRTAASNSCQPLEEALRVCQ